MALRTWLDLLQNRLVLLLLLITTLYIAGQFVIFTYMGPLLSRLTGASADAISLVFALYGVFGFLGVAFATRIVDSWGAYRVSLLFMAPVLAGTTGFAVTTGNYLLMAGSVAIWGLGFAAVNSMQQVRLVAAAPPLASASVSLNTSVLYIGQAIGSGDRRTAVWVRPAVRDGLCRRGLCGRGAADRDRDPAAAGPIGRLPS